MATDVFKLGMKLFGHKEPEAKPVPAKKPIQPWHAVSIAPGHRHCAAAKALRDQRFLSKNAPTLPLKDCDCKDCGCRYAHYEDRRDAVRRARDVGVSVDGHVGDERRADPRRGRRKGEVPG